MVAMMYKKTQPLKQPSHINIKGIMKKKKSLWWNIEDPIYGRGEILPNTIRYYKNERHPYGWEISFSAYVSFEGQKRKRHYSALGIDRNCAMANALPRH
jgi:hypothetical protein